MSGGLFGRFAEGCRLVFLDHSGDHFASPRDDHDLSPFDLGYKIEKQPFGLREADALH